MSQLDWVPMAWHGVILFPVVDHGNEHLLIGCLLLHEENVVLHISEDSLELYVMRSVPDSEVEPLEVHFFICSDCRDRLVAVLNAATMRAAVEKC
jgi:hypothetical protein